MQSLAGQLAAEGGPHLGPLLQDGDPSRYIEEKWVQLLQSEGLGSAQSIQQNIGTLKQAILGPGPTPVEEMQADMMIQSWLQRHYIMGVLLGQLNGPLGQLAKTPEGDKALATWIKLADVPISRFNQSFRLLVYLRELASKKIGPEGLAQGGPAAEAEAAKIQEVAGDVDQQQTEDAGLPQNEGDSAGADASAPPAGEAPPQ